MGLGLKRSTVELFDHDPEWETLADKTIALLWSIFRSTAKDIQHVGSTAIRHIKAKPIIDIVIGVQNFESLSEIWPLLVSNGICKPTDQPFSDMIVCSINDREKDTRLYNLQIAVIGSKAWTNHINFRDFMNAYPEKARIYESIKIELAKRYPNDLDRYANGKEEFITECLNEAKLL